MTDAASNPVFLVDAYSDPVVVRIDGRASFQNSACLRDFVAEMLRRGDRSFIYDRYVIEQVRKEKWSCDTPLSRSQHAVS